MMRCSSNRAISTNTTAIRILLVYLTSKAICISTVTAFTLGPGLPPSATITPTFRTIERCTAIRNSKDVEPSSPPPPSPISNDGNTEENEEDGTATTWPTAPGYFSRVARTVSSLRNMNDSISSGDVIFAKRDVPSCSIYADQGYDVVTIYHQGIDENTGRVEKVPVSTLDEPVPLGYTCYVKLYSPTHHGPYMEDGAVVVTPEEVGLVSMRAEVNQSLLLAIPGLFWVFVCIGFANTYKERYGGTFMDAFWGT